MNLISVFMNYKLKRLLKYAQTIENSNNPYYDTCYNKYLTTYIKTYYYHVLETLNYSANILFDDNTIKSEFFGQKQELLDDLAEQELVLSNEEYDQDKELITRTLDIAFLVSLIDRMELNNEEEINEKINLLIGDRLDSITCIDLIGEIRVTFKTVSKFFNALESDAYDIEYFNIKDKTNMFFLSLNYNIKVLDSNYKKNFIDKVYREDILSRYKLEEVINLISRDILINLIVNKDNDSYYFLELDGEVLAKKDWLDKMLSLLDNPVIIKKLSLLVDYRTFSYNKNYLEKKALKYNLSIKQDLSHIYNVTDKLTSLENFKIFKYIVISDFKSKDKEELDKYTVSTAKEILYLEEK